MSRPMAFALLSSARSGTRTARRARFLTSGSASLSPVSVPPEWDPFVVLHDIQATVSRIDRKVSALVTEDAAVQQDVAEIEAQVTAENAAITSLTASFQALEQEVASGTAAVSPATMASLAQAVADLTTATSGASALASQEAAAVPSGA